MAYMMAVAHIMRRNGRIEVVEPVTTIVGRWIKSGLVTSLQCAMVVVRQD
jgi:hypothetical protein